MYFDRTCLLSINMILYEHRFISQCDQFAHKDNCIFVELTGAGACPLKGNQVKILDGPATVTGLAMVRFAHWVQPGRGTICQESGNLPVKRTKCLRGKVEYFCLCAFLFYRAAEAHGEVSVDSIDTRIDEPMV